MNAIMPQYESAILTACTRPIWKMLRWDGVDATFLRQWQDLAARSAQANPFYEHWYLMPSLQAFDTNKMVRLFTLTATTSKGDETLLGLLPIVRSNRYGRWPIAHLSNWLHPNIFLGEPLIASGFEEAFWTALYQYCDMNAGNALFLHMNRHYLNSVSTRAMHHGAMQQSRSIAMVQAEERAILSIQGDTPQTYAGASLTGKKRKELRRQANRLGDIGTIVHQKLEGQSAIDGLDVWMADFLALEAKGWKGKAGSALACDDRTISLFRRALLGSAAEGRLQLLDIRLDERPIAMLVNFLTPPYAFSYKTAYDEDYARFSPGVLLQMDNLALLNRADLIQCDSCAAPDHPMIDSIWRERCTMTRHSIGIGGSARRRLFDTLLKAEMRRMKPTNNNTVGIQSMEHDQ